MKVMLFGSPVAALRDGLVERVDPDTTFVEADYADPAATIAERLEGCAALITVRYDAAMPPAPTLRLVQVPGVGTDEIALEHLPAAAALCNVSEHGPAVAEYVVGALLARATGLCAADATFRAGSWQHSSRVGAAPHAELYGARVGIVGFGLIGREVARRLKPFGVGIEVCNRSDPGPVPEISGYHPLHRLRAMAAGCDVLIVTVALTAETAGLVDRAVLAALPAGAVLVNVARGPIVDEDALFQALESGHLGGAVIDVWWQYPAGADDLSAPPSRHDFGRLENVVMTPHISGWTGGTLARRLDVMANNLKRLARGEPLLNVVRPPR
jgi:phosphoglycerate dehydrogenase-like enzyme